MAAETPFGLSFGDPRRYMGKSPLAQVGQAAKLGLVLAGLHKSGAIKGLDNLGINLNEQGQFSFKPPNGSIPPATRSMAPQPVPPQLGAAPPAAPVAAVPPAAPDATVGVQVTPVPDAGPSNVQINTFAPPPPDAGMQILNNTFRPQSSVDVTNDTDFNTFVPDMGNQMAISPNDYMNNPGFGKLKKLAGQFMGMG